jgi:hypothetical protein
MTSDSVYLDDEIGLRVHRLRQQAKALEEEADRLLDSLNLGLGQYISGEFIIKISPTVRFDAGTAERNLSPEEFRSILKETPNAALAKAVLGNERYRATQKTYDTFTRKVERVEE